MKRVFAFDMGKVGIGYCVREDNDIKELGSLIVDIDHSSVKENRDRRRIMKTIEAHREREKWFNNLWIKNGLKILPANDKRFTREFAAKNDITVYNSAVLRCKLILGERLEEWQIYKALHSAIQRRGYDNNLAWANSADDKENEEAVKRYSFDGDKELIKNELYKYPCFYDALLQGLWTEENPKHFNGFLGLSPKKIRKTGRVAPRCLVEKELIKLWEEAKKTTSRTSKNFSRRIFVRRIQRSIRLLLQSQMDAI